MGVAAGIASLSRPSQVISSSGLAAAIVNIGSRSTSGHVVSGIAESSLVENVGVAAEIASPSLTVQKLFLLPVSSPPF